MPIVQPLAAAAAVLALTVPVVVGTAAPADARQGAAVRAAAVPTAGAPLSLAVVAAAPTLPATGAGEPALERVNLLAGAAPRGVDVLATVEADESVLNRTLPTDGAAVVGLAWEPATDALPGAAIRFRTADGWQPWSDVEMEASAGAEQAARAEGSSATGSAPAGPLTSEAMVAAGAEEVEVRLTGLGAAPLRSAELVLVDGGDDPATGLAGAASAPSLESSTGSVTAATTTATSPGRPAVISRARWRANEVPPSPGCAVPNYGTRLERFVVHHTAGTNAYSAADSPAILRGIQRYHVEARGWCDMGYNVVVDKYGQVFEARRGGVEELVVGVHASGFNTNTVGVSVLGDYTKVAPSEAAIDALVHVIGWKSYLHGVDPAERALKGGVLMDRVIGHREVAQTSCPGAIQNRLDEIARRARAVMLSYQPQLSAVSATGGALFSGGARVAAHIPVPATWALTVTDSATGAVVRRIDGAVTRRTNLVQVWDGTLAGSPAAAPPGTYRMRLTARSTVGKDFSADAGTVTLTHPAGFVPSRVASAVTAGPAGTSGDVRHLRRADLGLPTRTAAVVLRMCSPGAATLSVGPEEMVRATDLRVRTADLPGGCGLVLVGLGTQGSVRIAREPGSAAVTVDVEGHLNGPVDGAAYWDLPAGAAFLQDIGWATASRITTGYVDGTFRPGAAVSREAMAAFLYRAAGSPAFTPPGRPTFTDVSTGHPFYRAIEWMASRGVAFGTDLGDGRSAYLPAAPVSRQATAAFLHRLAGEGSTASGATFPDVPATSPFAAAVGWLAASGVTRGYDDGTFRPTARVSRQAMAAFLHRADGL